jgi:hypothetical protein
MFTVCIADAVQQEEKNVVNSIAQTKEILEIDKSSALSYYAIKDNELYLVVWKSDEGRFLYKYEKEKLKYIKMNKDEIENFVTQYSLTRSDELEGQKIEISGEKSLILRGWTEAINFYNIYISDGQKEKNVTNDRYLAELNSNYLYIDKENEKIYFDAWNRTKYTDKQNKERKEEKSGIFVYDIKADKFALFKAIERKNLEKRDYIEVSYKNPIRVPNTNYLMYIVQKTKSIFEKQSGTIEHYLSSDIGIEVWIEEIPEWKSEIEAKEKVK